MESAKMLNEYGLVGAITMQAVEDLRINTTQVNRVKHKMKVLNEQWERDYHDNPVIKKQLKYYESVLNAYERNFKSAYLFFTDENSIFNLFYDLDGVSIANKIIKEVNNEFNVTGVL